MCHLSMSIYIYIHKLFKEVLYGVCKVGPLTSRVCTQSFIDFLEITVQHCSSKNVSICGILLVLCKKGARVIFNKLTFNETHFCLTGHSRSMNISI